MTKHPPAVESKSTDISDQYSSNTPALNPLVGIRSEDLTNGALVLFNAIINDPVTAPNRWFTPLSEFGEIAAGSSRRTLEAKDKRFVDATWQNNKVHLSVLQTSLVWGDSLQQLVNRSKMCDEARARAQMFTSMLIGSVIPTNIFLSNPSALGRFIYKGGESVWSGLAYFVDDLQNNGGLPSQVDKSALEVGKTLATTPTVRKRPLAITPPQINKFYSSDLTPDKSLLRFLVNNGIQVFAISCRNPNSAHRDWELDTYVSTLDEVVDAAMEIVGAEGVLMFDACSGGTPSSVYLAMLAARQRQKLPNIILAVCVLDRTSGNGSRLAPMMTPEVLQAAKPASQTSGVLDGEELAKVFAWMRANDLIWNCWVNNYLLGQSPLSLDILFSDDQVNDLHLVTCGHVIMTLIDTFQRPRGLGLIVINVT